MTYGPVRLRPVVFGLGVGLLLGTVGSAGLYAIETLQLPVPGVEGSGDVSSNNTKLNMLPSQTDAYALNSVIRACRGLPPDVTSHETWIFDIYVANKVNAMEPNLRHEYCRQFGA